jgi:hypothetical protein
MVEIFDWERRASTYPYYDPLEWMIAEALHRGFEFHVLTHTELLWI